MGIFERNYRIMILTAVRGSAGVKIAAGFGGTALAITAVCIPFVAPGLKKHALPFIPATDLQLKNIKTALEKHGTNRDLIDIGSGDGRSISELRAWLRKWTSSQSRGGSRSTAGWFTTPA